MSGRKLNPTELKLHQSALADPQKTLTARETESLVPDANARTAAINFLLGTGLLKVLKGSGDNVSSYRAVTKKELEIKKDMSGEENMVLSHIQASGNEGIWTKHLKAKTELHQTVIDRCLKSLMQKQLIKSIKAVKHPTRKIYMLFHLQPSVEITGGPWYTDNELDTEFIKLLSSACLHYIRDRSFPKQKRSGDQSPHSQPLFPIGGAPSYPGAKQIQSFLDKSKITETELSVEHVEMLLNVLILDGEIEKVPSFGAAMWESKNKDSDGDDDEEEEANGTKRKNKSGKDSRKYKRRRTSRIDDDSSDSDIGSSKGKRRKKDERSDTASSDEGPSEKRKKKRKVGRDTDDDENTPRRRKRKQQSETERETDDDHNSPNRGSWKRSTAASYDFATADLDDSFGGAYVYRAIRQERVALGWSQAPCGGCPVFEFCKEKGPVNPRECTYYEDWLRGETVAGG
ncbi:hypothetical protein PILCRDRAFT_810404 [Piloderma croceum F 1598]|uniref:DNA-directed RNA polymerase III subunit RPC6 n=1 Tax=Piloderma croceum (strain F 1598) TaxID=765440 RepID=A0A0C3GP70_PILCF|nr:hypothetical protein PILCRDRAFT_810404 [Piloderma croceum F 1598]